MAPDSIVPMNASSDITLQNLMSASSVDAPLPFDNAKNNFTETVRFVGEINRRSTFSLLISCCITLGLCSCLVIRLNISPKGKRGCGEVLRWWIVALFMPEVVLYTALRQLVAARQLCDEVHQAGKLAQPCFYSVEKSAPESKEACVPSSTPSSWTMVHSFYAIMGGFIIDCEDSEGKQSRLFGNSKRLTLTSKGVALLAQCGHLQEISVSDMKDKTRGSSLATALICIQAGWMIVQVITRAAANLPSTLLELYTVAHALLTLVTYVVWWHKPHRLAAPTLLRGENMQSLVMYMYLASRMSGDQPIGRFRRFLKPQPELQKLAYLETDKQTAVPDETQTALHHPDTKRTIGLNIFVPRPLDCSHHDTEPSSPMPEDEFKLEQRKLAAQAVTTYPVLHSRFNLLENQSPSKFATYLTPYTSELVQSHSSNWLNAGLLERSQSYFSAIFFYGIIMAHGAILISAWNFYFPTSIERLFWHLSSSWLPLCATLGLLINLSAHLVPFIDHLWTAYNERRMGWQGTGIITVLCILCCTSYVVSRAFLVLEAFVSLRKVPTTVYQTLGWIQALPHL